MIVLPAIDILDGQTVRLSQGDFDAKTVYDADPLDAARRWVGDGARRVAEAVRGTYAYSGGVSTLDDLGALVELRQVNLRAVIVGKALYEGRFTVAEALEVLDR